MGGPCHPAWLTIGLLTVVEAFHAAAHCCHVPRRPQHRQGSAPMMSSLRMMMSLSMPGEFDPFEVLSLDAAALRAMHSPAEVRLNGWLMCKALRSRNIGRALNESGW